MQTAGVHQPCEPLRAGQVDLVDVETSAFLAAEESFDGKAHCIIVTGLRAIRNWSPEISVRSVPPPTKLPR